MELKRIQSHLSHLSHPRHQSCSSRKQTSRYWRLFFTGQTTVFCKDFLSVMSILGHEYKTEDWCLYVRMASNSIFLKEGEVRVCTNGKVRKNLKSRNFESRRIWSEKMVQKMKSIKKIQSASIRIYRTSRKIGTWKCLAIVREMFENVGLDNY